MNKKKMLLAAFIFYSIAAFQLLFFSFSWEKIMTHKQILIGFLIGVPIGILKYFLVFNHPNKKNYKRIISGPKKQKLVSVFKPATYVVVLAMIFLGLSLRLIFNVPRHIIMPIYLAIGIGLLISCGFYFFKYIKFVEVKS